MATVGEAAARFDVSDQTIRTWSGEFQEYLSPAAEPGQGKPRFFTEEDLRVFAQVSSMRERNAGYEEIHQSLAAGDRAEPPRPEEEPEEEQTRAIVTRLTATVARYEGELVATKEALDHARQKLDEERAARVEAEKTAARLQGQLDILRPPEELPTAEETSQAPEETTAADQGQEEGRSWWQFWKR